MFKQVGLRVMPWVFVLIWSTGFIVAKLGMPYAPPMRFLCMRFLISIICFLIWIQLMRVTWPKNLAQTLHIAITGVLMHMGYLGGVWAAVKAGMGSGLAALIVGLQPILTALWQSRHGESLRPRQWLGFSLGLAGLALVVAHKFGQGQVNAGNVLLTVLALLSITTGTLYQKRYVQPCDVRTANAVQLMAACVVAAPLAWLEVEPMVWHTDLVVAMAWSVLVVTLGGSSLLYLLIQRGAATAVTSLLYLVPPTTAFMAWVLFDEPISALTLLGTVLTAWGVSWVVRAGKSKT